MQEGDGISVTISSPTRRGVTMNMDSGYARFAGIAVNLLALMDG